MLFENDLINTKQRAVEQLESLREQSHSAVVEAEQLRMDNKAIKNHIKRYQNMINNVNDIEEHNFSDNTFKASNLNNLNMD